MTEFGPVVDYHWLQTNWNNVQVFDARWLGTSDSSLAQYLNGHLPGAPFVDLNQDLSAPPAQPGGRHPFPSPAAFAQAMRRAGCDGVTPAVIYDTANGGFAARMWFMLHMLGCPAALLDGGLAAWTGELETGRVEPAPSTFEERPWPQDRLVSADQVAARIADGGYVADARSADRFNGSPHDLDDRYGHVPGARSRPWTDNISADGGFKPIAELAEHWAPAIKSQGETVPRPVLYCGSGVTACNNMAALALLGVEADLYVGSWSEWGADLARPIET